MSLKNENKKIPVTITVTGITMVREAGLEQFEHFLSLLPHPLKKLDISRLSEK